MTPKTEGDGERKGGRERQRKTERREMDRGNKDSSKGIIDVVISGSCALK